MIQCPKANILVVDDFEPWRCKIREILQARPEWTIVAEACDGPEAIQKATKLQPDVIILDIGLPTLNGIDAAKIIQQRCPEARIIFLTLNKDREIVSEALGIRRARYVLKINAATELLDAILAALHDCYTAVGLTALESRPYRRVGEVPNRRKGQTFPAGK
jgi:DNA-binding NarL/FixJ family response regulator